MTFYIVVHVILGGLAGNSAAILTKAAEMPGQFPKWIHAPWVQMATLFSGMCALAAIPTTFVQWDLMWSLATILELAIGQVLVVLLPMGLRVVLVAVGPFVCFYLMGALWGFWYI